MRASAFVAISAGRIGRVVELAPGVAPAERQAHRIALGQDLVARVAIDLQRAREALKVPNRLSGGSSTGAVVSLRRACQTPSGAQTAAHARAAAGRRPCDPVGQGRAIQIHALPGKDLGLPVERQVISVFRDRTWATVASVGMPPSTSRAGAGACTQPPRKPGRRISADA